MAAAAKAGELSSAERAAGRDGLRFVGGLLLLLIVALGLGLRSVSEVQEIPTEQYHVVADPLVLVAAGLVIAGLWRATTRGGSTTVGRVAAGLAILARVVWNVGPNSRARCAGQLNRSRGGSGRQGLRCLRLPARSGRDRADKSRGRLHGRGLVRFVLDRDQLR
jgi:hypothetical protein